MQLSEMHGTGNKQKSSWIMKHKIFAICGFNILDNIVSNEIKFSGIFWYF